MIKASIDRPKLEKSLKRFAKDFGETNAQAVVRWGIQACREMAYETQVWGRTAAQSEKRDGKGTGPQAKQQRTIMRDAYNVLFVARTIKPVRWQKGTGFLVVMEKGKNPFNVTMDRVLMSESEVNWWIDGHASKRKTRTRKLPATERKFCTAAIFKKAMAKRFYNVGIAKGGWVGAGQDIARAQTGMDRVTIGKNYFGYAHKHAARFGSAKRPKEGYSPAASVTNSASHSSTEHVLKRSGIDKAVNFALRKTLNWYRHAVSAINKKSA